MWVRIATQYRSIAACLGVAGLILLLVLTAPGSIHPQARVIFGYSTLCAVVLIPLYLISARAACRMVPRNAEVLRRKEQFGRPIDKTDLTVGEMLRSIVQTLGARLVRYLLLGLLIYLCVRRDWGLELLPLRVHLALIWGLAVFVALGGVAARPLRSRGRSAFLGIVVVGIGLVAPAAVVLYLATTAALCGAVFAGGIGLFQHPLMHSRAVTDPIMSGELGKSIGDYMQRPD